MTTANSEELLTVQERIQLALDALPVLTEHEIALLADDSCPICLVPFLSLVNATAEPLDGSVTKVSGCGHVFCKEDLSEWIRGQHGSCPTCRHPFLDVKPPSESDDESSDGGEYLPPSDDFEDEDDGFLDTDGFTDGDAEDFAGDDGGGLDATWEEDIVLTDDVCEENDVEFGDDIEVDGGGDIECGIIEGNCGSTSETANLETDTAPHLSEEHEGLEYDVVGLKQ